MSLPTAPAVSRESFAYETRPIGGPAVLEVVAGELLARSPHAEVVRLVEGDVLSVRPMGTSELAVPNGSAKVLLFEPDPAWCRGAIALAGGTVEESSCPAFMVRGGTDLARHASRVLRRLEATVEEAGASARLVRMALGLDLLAVACGTRASLVTPGARRGGKRLRAAFLEALSRLDEADLERVSLSRFAGELGCSERHATRLFKEELGRTFREHLVHLRLERTKELLRSTDHSIVEVSAESGWRSLGHFNEMFRRHVGLTPSGFRTRVRSEAPGPDSA